MATVDQSSRDVFAKLIGIVLSDLNMELRHSPVPHQAAARSKRTGILKCDRFCQ